MLNLDLKKAQELVAEAIAERGITYEYEKQDGSCLYVHDISESWDETNGRYEHHFENATPGCLVGLALNKGGIPLEVLGGRYNNDIGADELLGNLQDQGFVQFTLTASAYLMNAQASQDEGAPWQSAATAAANGDILKKTYEHDTDGKFWTGAFHSVPYMSVE